MKKKILLPIFALALVGSLAACNGGDQPSSSGDDPTSSGGGASSAGASSSEEPEPTGATAVGNFVSASTEEKTEILGKLEEYAVDNAITGLPLYENGGYMVYQNRVVKGVSQYITGYGFGILRSGRLDGTLTGEIGKLKPTYYHTMSAEDPKTVNIWNSDGSDVSDLQSYMGAGYYGTKEGADGKSYEWIPILATKARPWIVENGVAREATANDQGTTWRIYVRTNDDSLVYRTPSTATGRAAYDGRKVVLEDYLTPYKIMLTGGNKMSRGAELAARSGKYGIKGAAEYYNGTMTGTINDELFASTVGIKTGNDNNGDYVEFETLAPTTRFYAMYSFSDNLYQPIPRDFWNLVTGEGANVGNWFASNSDAGLTPVDNSLSVGPYYLESWETEKAISFAKNESWKEYDPATGAARTGIYNIPGVYISIVSAFSSDSSAGIKQFEAGNVDASSVPLASIDTYKNDPRTVQVPGSNVWKLNVNSCTQEEWEEKFGENGTICHTAKADYYQCKPWMSNDDFIRGLFFSIDRETFATKRGYISSINYFSSNYMSDPEGGVSYNATAEHEAAIEDFWGDTVETGGYSLALAEQYYGRAIEAMLASGDIKSGDKLTIDLWWMATSQISSTGNEIVQYIETAFNSSSAAKANNLTLTINQDAPANQMDVYEKHLDVGQFDLGFGSITGNALDPLNFMEVLKSNNSSGFTLNWGPDTSVPGIEYKDQIWSFDALWAAADHGICTYKGAEIQPVALDSYTTSVGASDELTIEIDYTSGNKFLADRSDEADVKNIIDSGAYDAELTGVDISDQNYLLYISASFDEEKGTSELSVTLDEEEVADHGVTLAWDKENEKITIVIPGALITALWEVSEAYYEYYYEYYYATAYATYYARYIAAGKTEAEAAQLADADAKNYAANAEAMYPSGLSGFLYSYQRISDLESTPTTSIPNYDVSHWRPASSGDEPTSSESASSFALLG